MAGCATHQADTTAAGAIESVRVTTNTRDVRDCRVIRHVDSRDTALGCGSTVQASVEECLRYQVVRAGGDTLLMRGPAGEAYDCGRTGSPAAAVKEPPPAPTAPEQASTLTLPTPVPTASEPLPSVHVTFDRSSARGCIYLGDVDWTTACGESAGAPVGPCADKAQKLGGNLVVHGGAVAEVFWCRPAP